jgi:hypothetical protein
MKSIALGMLVMGSILVTSCGPQGDPLCALSDGFSLSSNTTTVTSDGTVFNLKALVCTNTPAPPVDFYDGTTKVGTLNKPSASQVSGPNIFDVYSFPVSVTKAQNGSRVYTAKITLRGTILTTNEVTVTVNIP